MITFCSIGKDKISKNLILSNLLSKKKKDSFQKIHISKFFSKFFFLKYIWTWSSLREIRRKPFQRPGPSYQKKKSSFPNFQKKKKKIIFQKTFFRTTFRPNPLWKRYVGNLFKSPGHNHSKKHFFLGSKSKHFFFFGWI